MVLLTEPGASGACSVSSGMLWHILNNGINPASISTELNYNSPLSFHSLCYLRYTVKTQSYNGRDRNTMKGEMFV